MLEMRRRLPIGRYYCPAVFEDLYFFRAEVDHRLDREHKARFDLRPFAVMDVIQDGWIFVQRPSNTVAAELPNDSILIRVGQFLDSGRDIGKIVSRYGLLDRAVEALLGDLHEPFDLPWNLADWNGHRRVAVVTIIDDTEVEPHN